MSFSNLNKKFLALLYHDKEVNCHIEHPLSSWGRHKEIRHVPEIGLDNGDRVVVDTNTIGRSRTHAQCGFFSYVGALTPKIDL